MNSSHPFECQVAGETIFGVSARQELSTEDAVAPLPLCVEEGIWSPPSFQPTPGAKPKPPPEKIDCKKIVEKKIDDKEDKDKTQIIDDKGKNKSREGSGVPWVLVIVISLALLSAGAFLIRRSRRVAQFADSA